MNEAKTIDSARLPVGLAAHVAAVQVPLVHGPYIAL